MSKVILKVVANPEIHARDWVGVGCSLSTNYPKLLVRVTNINSDLA